MNVRKKRYRSLVCVLLFLSLCALAICGWAVIRDMIPDRIQVESPGEQPRIFDGVLERLVSNQIQPDSQTKAGKHASEETQAIEAAEQAGNTSDLVNTAEQTDSYEISYSLFGKIPLKTVSVAVTERKSVYAGGMPIGIYLETDGVFVVDTGMIRAEDGSSSCPAENIVQSGDYIRSVNGKSLTTKEELVDCIAASAGEPLVMEVFRQGEEIQLKVTPVKDVSGTYRAGIWVRNDTQGIGTLTYIDEGGRFGALGHGISDVDTGELLNIQGGTLYSAEVVSVVKGVRGSPGELSGIIHYSEGYQIGRIEENGENGIYGRVSSPSLLTEHLQQYETAHRQEIEEGAASILCTVGGSCREYQAEIREIRLNEKNVNKGMVLEVTDPDLLSLTGGIVQGMSGSPILQNGRIVGAVTHVFVNDPTKGYGIFIDTMLEHGV